MTATITINTPTKSITIARSDPMWLTYLQTYGRVECLPSVLEMSEEDGKLFDSEWTHFEAYMDYLQGPGYVEFIVSSNADLYQESPPAGSVLTLRDDAIYLKGEKLWDVSGVRVLSRQAISDVSYSAILGANSRGIRSDSEVDSDSDSDSDGHKSNAAFEKYRDSLQHGDLTLRYNIDGSRVGEVQGALTFEKDYSTGVFQCRFITYTDANRIVYLDQIEYITRKLTMPVNWERWVPVRGIMPPHQTYEEARNRRAAHTLAAGRQCLEASDDCGDGGIWLPMGWDDASARALEEGLFTHENGLDYMSQFELYLVGVLYLASLTGYVSPSIRGRTDRDGIVWNDIPHENRVLSHETDDTSEDREVLAEAMEGFMEYVARLAIQ